jgi:hypothetical protein
MASFVILRQVGFSLDNDPGAPTPTQSVPDQLACANHRVALKESLPDYLARLAIMLIGGDNIWRFQEPMFTSHAATASCAGSIL